MSAAPALLRRSVARLTAAPLSTLSTAARAYSVQAKAVRVGRPGHPSSAGVLSLATVPLDSASLKGTDVLVRILAAPITPVDFALLSSSASASNGKAGTEGVGIVEAVGPDVKGIAAGSYVVASKPGAGTWATHTVASADHWTVIDQPKGTPIESVAVSVVAPILSSTLLSKSGLKKGDTLIQNNAGSTVGQAIIQYAAAAGIRTVNIMRKSNEWASIVNHLQGLGAGVVVDEDYARTPAFGKLLADGAKPTVAFNSVGGPSAGIIAKALAPGGKLVTFGASSRKGVHLASSLFLSKGLSAEGFNLQSHLAGLSKEERDKLVRKAVADVSGEKPAVKQLVAREPFANFSSAIARSLAAGERKVVLVMPTQ